MWTSGSDGVILRYFDKHWQTCTVPPGGAKLDFRGIWASTAKHAFALASGPGSASQLFETTDSCEHWSQVLSNKEPSGFWDALIFLDPAHGWLLGDPVKGRFTLLATTDFGAHWRADTSAGLRAHKGEALFAASNSALAALDDTIWFGTGGARQARVFRLRRGSWSATGTPLKAGSASAGIFSIAFRDPSRGVVVGGDYKNPNAREGSAAFTGDGGDTWLPAVSMPNGYRSAVAWSSAANAWLAAGPNGVDVSKDDGKTWRPASSQGGNALAPPWLVGPHGLITTLTLR